MHFFTQSFLSFLKTCPYHLNRCRCTTLKLSSIRSLSLNSLHVNLCHCTVILLIGNTEKIGWINVGELALKGATPVLSGVQLDEDIRPVVIYPGWLSFSCLLQWFDTVGSLPSNRHHLSNDYWLVSKRKNYQVCSVQYCVQQLCTVIDWLIELRFYIPLNTK